MKLAEAILTVSLAVVLAGCVLRGTPNTAQTAPAPPRPTVAQAPAQPPEPLSIPQTQAELPQPQPVSAEALATTDPQPEGPAPTPVAPKPTRTRVSQPPHTEPPAPPPTVGSPAVAPPAAGPPDRPLVAPLVSAEEQRQLLTDTQHDRQEAKAILDRHTTRSLKRPQQELKRSIESYLQLSSEAEKRGDFRQARELVGRALVLAKELQP